MFRKLKANEIECRVATVKEKGVSLLLYKDARCDMNILDETFTPFKWKREHKRENANCIVSIWSDELNQWISKEDTGTESFTEKEKGLASDSFKRACFNWGIGRELYTAPFIWVTDVKIYDTKRKDKYGNIIYSTNDRFKVSEIGYDDNGVINLLSIATTKGKQVYYFKNDQPDENELEERKEAKTLLLDTLARKGYKTEKEIKKASQVLGVNKNSTVQQLINAKIEAERWGEEF